MKTVTERQKLYDKMKASRKGMKSFGYLKPKKVNKVWEIEINGRLYRNANKNNLIKDIETIENG